MYDAGKLHNKFERRHKKIWSSGDIEVSEITERKPTQMLQIYGDVSQPHVVFILSLIQLAVFVIMNKSFYYSVVCHMFNQNDNIIFFLLHKQFVQSFSIQCLL